MNARLFASMGLAVVIAAALWIFTSRQNSYEPGIIPGAHLHLAFEGTLDNIGRDTAISRTRDGGVVYAEGPTGASFYAQGDGSYLEIDTPDMRDFADVVEISFDFRADDWTNPYENGAAVKTIAVVTGRSGDRLRHAVFNISSGNNPSLSVSIEAADGAKERLTSPSGEVSTHWHAVRLRIDREAERSSLYLDDTLIGEARIVPSVITNGIDRVQVGTWYRQNQAYRGLIDNLVIRDVTG